jgi:hypothetical protein
VVEAYFLPTNGVPIQIQIHLCRATASEDDTMTMADHHVCLDKDHPAETGAAVDDVNSDRCNGGVVLGKGRA